MIGEAVRILRNAESNTAEVLNSKSEFSRCQIPRLVVQFGKEDSSNEVKERGEESKAGNAGVRESKGRKVEFQNREASSNTQRSIQTGFQSPSIISFLNSRNTDCRNRERVISGVT